MTSLNQRQREAVCHGQASGDKYSAGPLLVVAGAGTGKTATLCHRVAWLVHHHVPPDRIGLFTFSRRAAAEMARRAGDLLRTSQAPGQSNLVKPVSHDARFHLPWAGTFHSVAARLLRQHAQVLCLNPAFSIIDRGDAVDLIGWIRERQGLSHGDNTRRANTGKKRFPGAATCLNIYSDRVNSGDSLAQVLAARYPWCMPFETELRTLFAGYVERKLSDAVLDYDDLLLWWRHGMDSPAFADQVRQHFDHILVDEFQDSNALQMQILLAMRPTGAGLFAVGDDAQSIYSFRAARIEFMHEFPGQFNPPAGCVNLQENYRSTQAILDTANALMQDVSGPYKKHLVAAQAGAGARPSLAIVADDAAQADYVIDQVLQQREAGVLLREQAVLFRSAHHSDMLEVALTRSNIPFVKYGGLRFIEAAHVRDYLSVLRWSQNPRHLLAAFRAMQLLPGIGPVLARRFVDHAVSDIATTDTNEQNAVSCFTRLASCDAPAQAAPHWADFTTLMTDLADTKLPWSEKLSRTNSIIEPLVAQRYDDSPGRLADLSVLSSIAANAGTADRFLSDMALDPPNATGAWSEEAHLDEDYLTLSTVHSAKGQEWHNVFVLNVADGNFPNEYSTADPVAVAEERRLLYVAMTRARQNLHLIEPQRYYLTHQPRHGGAHVYGVRSRFLDDAVLGSMQTICPVDLSTESAVELAPFGGSGQVNALNENSARKPGSQPKTPSASPVAGLLRELF